MSTTQSERKSVAQLAYQEDGRYHCPVCADSAFGDMDTLMDHVSRNHEPIREWFVRWGGRQA